MRALTNHKPFDNNLNGIIYSNEINIAVICGKNYSEKLYNFLNQLNLRHATENINPDFLIEYDNVGFQNDGNHIHAILREKNSDFGEDILKNHYLETKH